MVFPDFSGRTSILPVSPGSVVRSQPFWMAQLHLGAARTSLCGCGRGVLTASFLKWHDRTVTRARSSIRQSAEPDTAGVVSPRQADTTQPSLTDRLETEATCCRTTTGRHDAGQGRSPHWIALFSSSLLCSRNFCAGAPDYQEACGQLCVHSPLGSMLLSPSVIIISYSQRWTSQLFNFTYMLCCFGLNWV